MQLAAHVSGTVQYRTISIDTYLHLHYGVSVMATMSILSASVAQHMQIYTTYLIHPDVCTALSYNVHTSIHTN